MIGSDFTVAVNGFSLGGALSLLFGFFASTDKPFTQNGPRSSADIYIWHASDG